MATLAAEGKSIPRIHPDFFLSILFRGYYIKSEKRKARVPEGLHPLLYSTIGEIEIFYTLMYIDFYFFVVFHQFQMTNLIQLVILKVLKTLEGIKYSES